jgi:DNA-directed RNA polymerase subunit H (RpoH/RPB5)
MGSLVIGIIAFQQVFLFGPQGLGTGRVRILPMMLFAMIPAGSLLLFQYLHSPGLWGMVHGYREWKRLTPEVREMPDADAVAVYLGHLAGVEALHLDIRRPEVMATVILSQKRTKQLLRAYSLSPQDIPRVTMERIVADTLENAAAEAAKQVQAAAQGA